MGREGKEIVVAESSSQVHQNASLLDHQESAANDCERAGGNSVDRDAALAQIAMEKKFAYIKAWEDSEKSKADNKACKKLYAVEAWENIRRACIEVELKQIEEHFEKKRAAYEEIMKNKMADIHRSAEEKRAAVVAKKEEDKLRLEAAAEKFRVTGNAPKVT
ncbi:remorin-like isoform X2 [Daucus carota subsp. sativus]|uniref:remorin-like isoform X2 n=1 Tax=Daucus carota subsp. sativus TaxID=79200 RepID=UPI0007EF2B9F|nr:PREDICTED: remorin-like isoform X2 [Daucus carota subsp. sativus]